MREGGDPPDERYSQIAAMLVRRAWRDGSPDSAEAPPPRVIGAVARELGARGRRRLATRWAGVGLASASAVAAGAWLMWSLNRPDPISSSHLAAGSPHRSEARTPSPAARAPRSLRLRRNVGLGQGTAVPPPDRPLAAGDSVVASGTGPATIVGDEGTSLVVERGGRLRVVEADATRRFSLTQGAVRAQVMPLQASERFIIDTEDTEIEVHGTRFRVSLASSSAGCPQGNVTRVEVSEGVVTVAWSGHDEKLLPGDHWSSDCPRASPSARSVSAAAAIASTGQNATERGPRRKTSRSDPAGRMGQPRRTVEAAAIDQAQSDPASLAAPPSDLAAQNQLFSSAVRARRNGRVTDSLGLFVRFLREYPASSLVESALVQRLRLLASTDHRAAADAATDYLSRFPNGFAREEADRVLATPSDRLTP